MVLAARFLLVLLLAGVDSVWAAEAEAGAVDDESLVLLLQTSAGLQRHSLVQPQVLEQPHSQADRLKAALPLVYVHVPKTGSSIANAFLRLPGVCPDLVEELGDDSFGAGVTHDFDRFRNSSLCPGLIAPPDPREPVATLVGDHMVLGNSSLFEEYYDGHALTILRQPEQRVISGLRMLAEEPLLGFGAELEELQPSEGCMVRMFVGEGEGEGDISEENYVARRGLTPQVGLSCFGVLPSQSPPPAPSTEDVTLALARLRQFAFVGIQEEWHLSVCLLHAMFGGECSAVEFENTRPSVMSQEGLDLHNGIIDAVFTAPEPYDTSILGGWVDTADRAVYDAGLEMFQARCDMHGVSSESCRPCYEAAGLL